MWSHYAEKHQGICIGIEVNLTKLVNDGFLTFPVIYENDFEPSQYFDKDINRRFEVISKYLSTKAKFWDYEEEVRIINTDYYKQFNSPFFRFDKYAEIKECLFGLKMGSENKKAIRKIIKHSSIELFEMVNVRNAFALKRELLR